MKKKLVNVLILDDNPIVKDCLEKRIEKASGTFLKETGIEIVPFHCNFSISNLDSASQIIEETIIQKKIDFLLLDRGFFDVIDPSKLIEEHLDNEFLFVRKGEKNIKIHEILDKVSFKKIKKLKGVIVYTFDHPYQTSEWYVEPTQIKRQIKEAIGNKVTGDNIEIVLTNSEIYNLAGINIYEKAGQEYNENYVYQGRKSEFALYGIFVGEILYHRIIRMLEKNRQNALKSKKIFAQRNLVLLFIIFTSLSIGGNAAYNYIFQRLNNNFELFLLSLIFALLFPILVLIIKPEWIINIEEE